MQMTRVAVVGGSGYAGGEVLRLLLGHPHVEIGAITANTAVGAHGRCAPPASRPARRPYVRADDARRSSPGTTWSCSRCRTASPPRSRPRWLTTWSSSISAPTTGWSTQTRGTQFYGIPHAGTWPYGLPELPTATGPQRIGTRGARRVAVPGCNATAVTLALAPGVAAGVVRADDVVAVLACAPSGAGRTLAGHLLASEILGAASPYGVGGTHRHIPEIEQNLQAAGADAVGLSFTPTLVPMARGILATVTAPIASGIDTDTVRAAWVDAYRDEPFVHVLPEGQWPSTASTVGSNAAQIQVTVDERAGRVVAVCAIDNLGKGAAGAAVQCLNLALGLPETAGLTVAGVAP